MFADAACRNAGIGGWVVSGMFAAYWAVETIVYAIAEWDGLRGGDSA
jgi:hypothetical protein